LITGDEEYVIHRYLDDEMKIIKDSKEYYRKFVEPEISKSVEKFHCEISAEEQRHMRQNYLVSELEKTRKLFEEKCIEYARTVDDNLVAQIETLEKKGRTLLMNIRILFGQEKGITPEMIAKAREYPITELIQHNRSMFAKCPFHNEDNPSFFIKKNFGYCFSCQASADSIDLYMFLNKVGFKTAVNYLSKL
jgi:hypothetical protein